MEHKKKYHGKLNLFYGLLCCLLLGCLSTTCYANMSRDYFDYAIETLSQNVIDDYTQQQLRTGLSNMSEQNKTYIFDLFNSFLDENNISDLQNVNFIFYIEPWNYSFCNFYILACNNGASYGIENIDHFLLNGHRLKSYSNGENNNKLYYLRFEYYFAGNISNITKSSITTNYLEINFVNSSNSYSFNNDITILTLKNCAVAGIPLGFCVYPFNTYSFDNPRSIIIQDGSENGHFQVVSPEPEPSGDSGGGTVNPSGDNSGESGGSTTTPDYTNQLNNINTGIVNVQNQISGDTQKVIDNQNNNTQTIVNTISGETQKITNILTEPADMDSTTITSGDILENFSFMADPYSNFWWDFIDGVELALLGSVRQLPVNWLGYNGYFNLDGLINYPTPLKNILTTVSTVAIVWIMLKWWKIIMDKLTSGDIDEVLEIVEEQGRVNITNLF